MRAILALTCALITTSALGNFHTFRIQELYSNADGTIQFLVLREAQSLNGEDVWGFKRLTSYRAGQGAVEFEFPRDLPTAETAQKYVLVATPAFAALGLITPNYIIPSGFLGVQGGQVDFAGVDAVAFDRCRPTALVRCPAEIELLDGGAYGGVWKRTGQIFNVWRET